MVWVGSASATSTNILEQSNLTPRGSYMYIYIYIWKISRWFIDSWWSLTYIPVIWYSWWKESCTSWCGEYPIFHRGLYIPGGDRRISSYVCSPLLATLQLHVFFFLISAALDWGIFVLSRMESTKCNSMTLMLKLRYVNRKIGWAIASELP